MPGYMTPVSAEICTQGKPKCDNTVCAYNSQLLLIKVKILYVTAIKFVIEFPTNIEKGKKKSLLQFCS